MENRAAGLDVHQWVLISHKSSYFHELIFLHLLKNLSNAASIFTLFWKIEYILLGRL